VNLTEQSATSLARLIRERQTSSEEVVRAHLGRIAEVNPRLNAVVHVDEERAIREARAADQQLWRGELPGPLHGVPFSAKDWLEAAGMPCAAGFAERRAYVPQRDATVVARLRAAGGILLGKTTVNDGAPFDPPRNPYDTSRWPGASSAGEAAIIAARGSPLGLGSDSGGSIRWPAHCCGVAGLKPTSGRVPLTGHFPRIGALSDPRTQVGPMARAVEDLGLALRLVAGPDWRDPSVVPMPIGDPEAVELRGLRAAWFTNVAGAEPTQETVAIVEDVAHSLAAAGLYVDEARPDGIDDSLAITQDYWRRPESISWSEWRTDQASSMTADEVEQSIFRWDRFRRRLWPFLEQHDVIICPAAAGPAPPFKRAYAEANDYLYTLPFSLTGWPVVTVRAGTSPDGLPLGVQVVAQPWREDVALMVAAHIERVFGGWVPPAL
jgi:amidase